MPALEFRILSRSAFTIRVAVVCLLAIGCNSDSITRPGAPRVGAPARPDLGPNDCGSCVVGPITLTRGTGAPETKAFDFAGDPSADYVIDIDDNGSDGLSGSVLLNGATLVSQDDFKGNRGFHLDKAVSVQAQNTLLIRLEGKPGATLSVDLRGGVKLVGADGGVVHAPGGNVTLDVPPGALTDATELSITPVNDPSLPGFLGEWDLQPSGMTFGKPLTLNITLPAGVSLPTGGTPAIVTRVNPDDANFTIVPQQTYDPAARRVSAPVAHFSAWLLDVLAYPDIICAALFVGNGGPFVDLGCPHPTTIQLMEGVPVQSALLAQISKAHGSFYVFGVMGACENLLIPANTLCVAVPMQEFGVSTFFTRSETGLLLGLHAGQGIITYIPAGGRTDIMVTGRVPVHLYSFMSTVADVGGTSATLQGGATLANGKLVLNGSTAFAELNSRIIPATGDFTVIFYARQATAQQTFVEFISQGVSGSGFYIGQAPTKVLRATDSWLDTGVPLPQDNQEHSYAFTYGSAANETRLYVDGIRRATHSGNVVRGWSGGNNTRFGRQFDPFAEFFNGEIDNVSVWWASKTDDAVLADSRRTPDYACSAAASLKSVEGIMSESVVFENRSGEALRIEWIDNTGARVVYQPALANNSGYTQGTYQTHPWIITGVTSGHCYGIWVPRDSRIVTVLP